MISNRCTKLPLLTHRRTEVRRGPSWRPAPLPSPGQVSAHAQGHPASPPIGEARLFNAVQCCQCCSMLSMLFNAVQCCQRPGPGPEPLLFSPVRAVQGGPHAGASQRSLLPSMRTMHTLRRRPHLEACRTARHQARAAPSAQTLLPQGAPLPPLGRRGGIGAQQRLRWAGAGCTCACAHASMCVCVGGWCCEGCWGVGCRLRGWLQLNHVQKGRQLCAMCKGLQLCAMCKGLQLCAICKGLQLCAMCKGRQQQQAETWLHAWGLSGRPDHL